jgi:hypothetical protein
MEYSQTGPADKPAPAVRARLPNRRAAQIIGFEHAGALPRIAT